MIVRWGRKGLYAGAIIAAFVTPVSVTNSINEVQHQPSFKQEVRHVTPVDAGTKSIHRAVIKPSERFDYKHVTPVESAGQSIHQVVIRPDERFYFRHITPVDEVTPEAPEVVAGGGGGGKKKYYKKTDPYLAQALREDEEIIEIIIALTMSDYL